jgi:ABC-2 type transport system ATP-binding protein
VSVVAPGPAVEIAGLVKRYGGRAVVDGLDLTVRQGEIIALLGPNGAGKTTTVEIVEGYRTPDGGEVRVLGLDPRRDASRLRARVGVMLQRAELYSQIRVLEAVRLFAAFYASALQPGMLVEQVGLAPRANDRYRTLSGGERQRLALALAIVGRPELAILDEPTAAMDVTARRSTWELLRALRAEGTTILLTTHLLDEAEALADRVAIIDAGRLVALGTPAELRAPPGGREGATHRSVRLELIGSLSETDVAALGRLLHVGGVRRLRDGVYSLATGSPGELLVELSAWLWAKHLEPLALEVERESLEEVFLRLTGEEAAT